jgi:HEAT repeat protein
MTRAFGDDVRAFLLEVFGNSDVTARGTLLTNFPPDLASQVCQHPAALVALQEVVNRVLEWGRLENGNHAVEVLLENVRDRVRGLALEAALDALRGRFRELLRQQQEDNLRIAVESPSPEERRAAAIAVADTVDHAIHPPLFSQLAQAFRSSSDDLVRFWLAIALGHTGRPEATEILTAAADRNDHSLVWQGICDALEAIRSSQRRKDVR